MPKISIIMPSLNVAKYIRQCIESVVNQTMKEVEILVIDAGSTDGTTEILEEFVAKDSRVKLIKSEKKSYGYQMNIGIAMAKGEYIGIVETDDLIELDMFENLYKKTNDIKPDYVKGTAEGFFELTSEMEYRYDIIPCLEFWLNKDIHEVVTVPKDNPQLFWNDNFLWYGIYRADFLKKVKFQETYGAAFQDIGALFQIISTAESGIYIRKSVYNYRRSNLEASSYNKKSINFVESEYENMKKYLAGLSDEWINMYYKKMLGLFLKRFDFMAVTGEYWEESQGGIDRIIQKIKNAFDEGVIQEKDIIDGYKDKVSILLTDSKKLFEHNLKILEDKKKRYNEILKKCMGRNVVIFGAGEYGKFLRAYMILKGVTTIKAFCDNKKEIQGSYIGNTKIISLEDSLIDFSESCYLITNKKHSEEIEEQLIENGIKKEDICIYKEEPDNLMLMCD